MIRLEQVSKSFGALTAVAPLDVDVRLGETLAVIGRNGSGKTSLLRMLVGLSRPTSGRVLLDGQVPGAREWRRLRAGLGYMPERIDFHEHLSGQKTLTFFARLRGVDPQAVEPLLESVGLSAAGGKKVGTYSKGMRQRLNLAQALLGDPPLLVLDEPVEGLDPQGVRRFFDLLGHVEGRTVVFTSHRLPRMAVRVDRICVLSGGRLKGLGSEDELRQRVELPTRVVIYPAQGFAPRLHEALARLSSVALVSENGRFVVDVAQTNKLSFFTAIGELSGSITDLRVEETPVEEALLDAD